MKISLRNLQWKVPIPAARLRGVARSAADSLTRSHALLLEELSLVVVSDTEIARLNEQFVRHRGTTDVITFDYSAAGRANGDRQNKREAANTVGSSAEIVISADTAQRQARRFRRPLGEELSRYVIHGLLHLSGYRDATPKQRLAMRRAEGALLKSAAKTGGAA